MNRAHLIEETPLFDCNIDIQTQRENDHRDTFEDECDDPAFSDWCTPARLMRAFADPNVGVQFLRKHDPRATDSGDQIYLTSRQEANRHDRILVDVPKKGRRKGGTHGLPPEQRRKRSATVVNPQLLRWDATTQDCEEGEGFYHTTNARISRSVAYVASVYSGKYGDVLELFLQGKSTLEIAETLGKSTRRVRQIVNGHAQRSAPGLRQFIDETLVFGVPSGFSGTAPAVATSAPAAKKSRVHRETDARGVQEVAA